MRLRSNRRRDGMTLIEVLVAMAVFLLALAGIAHKHLAKV